MRFLMITALGGLLLACGGGDSSPVCGDGVVDDGEVCDDGNTMDGDGCSDGCSSLEICGNGIVDGAVGESCDDGNVNGGGTQLESQRSIPHSIQESSYC